MLCINLRPLIYCDSFKLTKHGGCSVFRNNFFEKTIKNKSDRFYSSATLGKGNERLISLRGKPINVSIRNLSSRVPLKLTPSPVKWKTVAVVGVISGAFLLYFTHLKEKKLQLRESYRNKQIGKAQLGGAFDLIDQDNEPVKSENLYGDWLLLYFGFTHCPDICPEELEKMVEVVEKLEKKGNTQKVKPVFITVDPERDTPSVIKKYLKEFSDKIIGLTGTVQQISNVCKAYRVYFSPGPKDSDSDYIVDHSIIMYLIDPQGNFVDFFGQNKNADAITSSIMFHQAKYSNANKKGLQKLLSVFD